MNTYMYASIFIEKYLKILSKFGVIIHTISGEIKIGGLANSTDIITVINNKINETF